MAYKYSRAHIEISRSFKYMLPKPYSNCDLEMSHQNKISSPFLDQILKSGHFYSQDLCLTQCLQHKLIQECMCLDNFMISLYENTASCMTEKEINCSRAAKNLKENLNFCFNSCPLECYRMEFKTTVTSTNLIGEYFVDFIKQNKNLTRDFYLKKLDSQTTRESFIRLNVHYDSLAFIHSSESVKLEFFSLIGYVGGTLSLFLGLSFFSFSELFEALIKIYVFRNK